MTSLCQFSNEAQPPADMLCPRIQYLLQWPRTPMASRAATHGTLEAGRAGAGVPHACLGPYGGVKAAACTRRGGRMYLEKAEAERRVLQRLNDAASGVPGVQRDVGMTECTARESSQRRLLNPWSTPRVCVKCSRGWL